MHSGVTDRIDNTLNPCSLPTIWDRLLSAGRSARYYYSDTHNLIEGAGAAPLAALLKEKPKSGRYAVIASGGNIDREAYLSALSAA